MKIVKVVIGVLFIGVLYLHAASPVKKQSGKKDQASLYKTNTKRLKVVFGG